MKSKIVFLFLLINCLPGFISLAQTNKTKIIFMDTVEILDPLIIRFIDSSNVYSPRFQFVLVSKGDIDSLKVTQSKKFPNFLFSEGFLFVTAWRFRCLLEDYLYSPGKVQDSLFYVQLVDKVRMAVKDKVWAYFEKEKGKAKSYKGWEYYEIYPRKFLHFLVKGEKLRKCLSGKEIAIEGMDNIYFPVLVPLTW